MSLARAEQAAHHKAQQLSARLLMEHGVNLCEMGDPDTGLLWLGRSLAAIPEDEAGLERSVRQLLGGWQQELHLLRWHTRLPKAVRTVAYRPDGTELVSASKDTLSRWEARTGKPVGASPLKTSGNVLALCSIPPALGSGGLAAIVRAGQTVEVRALPDNQLLGPPIRYPANRVTAALSPDGKVVLLGGEDSLTRPYEVKTGQPLPVWKHEGAVRAIAFSRDGQWAVTGGDDNLARIWHVESGKQVRVLREHGSPILAVVFSPDGRFVVTGSEDHRACVWDQLKGTLLHRLRHQQNVEAVSFHPDGHLLATGSTDKLARVWDVATGRLVGAPIRHADDVKALAFSPDGRSLATGSDDRTLRAWQIRQPDLDTMLRHTHPVLALAASLDGKLLLTSTSNGEVRLWETGPSPRFRLVSRNNHNTSTAISLAFSPDGRRFLVGDVKGTAQLYETDTCKPSGAVIQHGEGVLAVAFSPDGRWIATGCNDEDKAARAANVRLGRIARIWDARTGKVVHHLVGPTRKVPSLCFSLDSKRLLTASWDHRIWLWDTSTGKAIRSDMRHLDLVQSVVFGPDGESALSGGDDYTARLWDLGSGKERGMPLRHPEKVQTVAFSPRGALAATGTKGNQARLWDLRSGKPVGSPLLHGWEVRSLCFSKDESVLYSGSWDGTVRRWPVPSPREGDVAEIIRWLEVHTGQRLDSNGAVVPLKVEEWEDLVRRGQ
jgi:WD40 repeat protein